jgi:hypothetical protein
MLSLLKKKSEAAAPLQAPWHPNFRNYEKLPDIKVIRTAFFVNGIAIFLAISLLTYCGFKEWQLRVLKGQIADSERQIAKAKPESDKAVKMYKQFQAEEAKINEVDAFVKSKPLVSSYVVHLARTLPSNIALDKIEMSDAGLILRLSVRGEPDVAIGDANKYVVQLQGDKMLTQRFEPAEMTSATPNPATGKMAVEINNRIKGAKK